MKRDLEYDEYSLQELGAAAPPQHNATCGSLAIESNTQENKSMSRVV